MKRILFVMGCAVAQASYAQVSDAVSNRLEARALRQDARALARESRAAAPPAAPAVAWDVSIGVAYTDAEDDTKVWNTPFVLKATFNDRIDSLKVTGDGYTRVKAPDGETANGFSDVSLGFAHTFYKKVENQRATKLLGSLGYTIPSHGEVGSSSGKARIGATYLAPLVGAWDGLVTASLSRSSAEPAPGTSRVGRSIFVQAAYSFKDAPGSDVAFQFSRSYRQGVGGSSQATAAYEFPVTSKGENGWIGSLSFTRGLTSGSRDNSIEFDLSLSF